jgi:hypothetical protein
MINHAPAENSIPDGAWKRQAVYKESSKKGYDEVKCPIIVE